MSRNPVLDDTGLPPEVCDLVLDQIDRKPGELRLILKNLGEKDKATAIKNEDFQLLRAAATLVGGFFAASSFVGWAPAAVASVVILLYEFRKKRIELTATQAAILRELVSHPGLTAKELAEGLRIRGLDEKKVGEELKALSEARRADGKPGGLVSSDGAGRWRAEDV
jgi:hypothetical protein